VLTYDDRFFLRRKRLLTSHIARFLVDLAAYGIAEPRGLFELEGGQITKSSPPREALLPRSPAPILVRLAWHIGNRTPLPA